MRALQLLILLVLIGITLYLLFRPRSRGNHQSVLTLDELVKDPVCQTYVVRSRAVRWQGADGPVYFCGPECARRYAAATRG